MPNYQYTARDLAGKMTSGSLPAGDVAEVRTLLRNKNLYLTTVREQAGPIEQRPAGLFQRRKVKLKDMVVMSRMLATLVRAGLPIVECLSAVSSQTENIALANALKQVRVDVLSGMTLADSLKKHPKIFNETYCSLVVAGETGGVLDQTLEVAATQFDKEADLRDKVKAAFVYPIIVFIASILVVMFMLVFIVPVFAKVYKDFGAKLPPITQMLIDLSAIVMGYWWIVIPAMIGVALLLKAWVKTKKGRWVWDTVKLKVPVLGKLNRKIAIARFTETLAGAIKAGVPILRALATAAQTSGNVIIMDAVTSVSTAVKEGATLSGPLESSGQFPPIVTKMVAAGEQSGNLDEMLEEVTHFFHRDIEYTVGQLTRIMEPAMTVVVGGIVLFVLLALYMPVFNLTQVVRRP
ncbi:MAG: type II secretion system F family protein [Armatimonadetes bacterium]|nr:type II secretion system F family protein [Armatimonadota bacterium]MDE2206327.1 type II secretion system F family protein [Armatimonadota bacterium]